MARDRTLRPRLEDIRGRLSGWLLPALLALVVGLSGAWASEAPDPTPTPTPAPRDRSDQDRTTKKDASGEHQGQAGGAATSRSPKPAPGPQTPPKQEASRPPAASSAPAPTPGARPQEQQAPLSFTDEDLQKYHRPPPDQGDAAGEEGTEGGSPEQTPAARPTPRPRPTPMQPDPLAHYKNQERDRAFRRQQIQGLRDKIAGLQARLDYLKLKRLAIVDPLRVMPKPQTDDEKQQEAKLGAKDLLAQVDEEIKSVQAELEDAQASLVSIETRFGAQAGLSE